MYWDLILDYMNAFLGAIIILLGLIFMPEVRKLKRRIIAIIIIVLLLFFIGIFKISRDNSLKIKNDKMIDSLNTSINEVRVLNQNLIKLRETDSSLNVQFQTKLFEEFKIIKDSSNQPKQVLSNYNTTINKAQNVHIGPN